MLFSEFLELTRAISASRLTSVAAGSVSQPAAGEGKPHRFRSRTIKSVISKSLEDTEDGITG